MDDDFIEAINATIDTSFDASVPTNCNASVPTNCTGDPITCPVVLNLLAKPLLAIRRSGSATTGFLDGEYKSGEPEVRPMYLGPPSGRVPNAEDKRGAWHLEDEYLAGRLGKNEEENGRLWNTVKWIERHNRIFTMPKEAIQALNIYTDGSERLDRLDVDNPDGGFPDDVNDGYNGYDNGKVDHTNKNELNLKIDDYRIGRLVDELKEVDKLAKIDVEELLHTAPPLPQVDFPDLDQRVESGKIICMLKLGMHTLWHPVIRAIADRVTMASLGKSQGVGDDKKWSAVGRCRIIEGLRLAESIRKRLERQKLKPARSTAAKTAAARCKIPTVSEMMGPLAAPKAVRAPASGYLNQAAGPVIKRDIKPPHANDNCRFDADAGKAA
jgi:hypothetical protein